jgi:DNA repair exonuclease SbcCD ATPase subunit
MKLTSFKARNIFQHELFEHKLDGNLIGIVGPNGSGKSNLLKSIQFTLAGEVPEKRKEQLLRWGAEDGGECTVEFVHEGTAGAVTRSVSGGKTGFKYGHGVDVTGITNVNTAIADHLGLDKDIARTVFVPQAELDSILFDQASKRELAFQRMCGIGAAAKLHKALGQLVTQKFPPITDFDEQIAIGKAEIDQMAQRLAVLESQDAALTLQLADVDEEAIRQKRIQYQELGHAAQAALRAEQHSAQLHKAVESDNLTIHGIDSSTTGIDLKEVDDRITAAQATLLSAKDYQARLQSWTEKRKALDELGQPPAESQELEKLSADLTTMRNAVGAIQGNLGLYNDLLKAIDKSYRVKDGDATFCPVCGSAIIDFDTLRQALKSKVANCQAELAQYDVDASNQRYQQITSQVTTWATRDKLLTDQEARAKQLLDATDQVDTDVHVLQIEITKMNQVRAELERMFRQRAEVQVRLDLNSTQYATACTELTNAKSKIQACGGTGADYAQLQQSAVQGLSQLDQTVQAIQQQRQQQAGVRGQIGEIKSRSITVEAGMDSLIHRRDQQGTYNQVRATVDSVREWLHYANGPHSLAVSIMEELTGNVNTFLQKLNAPFAALTDDTDLSYRCPFTDGRTMPAEGPPEASELSGGQKTLLAISFRLASYCMFANKQGLLSLDEPTADLDADNVANFCNLLEKVKDVARAMDLQIFLSTHERAILPFCDSVIDLYPKEVR